MKYFMLLVALYTLSLHANKPQIRSVHAFNDEESSFATVDDSSSDSKPHRDHRKKTAGQKIGALKTAARSSLPAAGSISQSSKESSQKNSSHDNDDDDEERVISRDSGNRNTDDDDEDEELDRTILNSWIHASTKLNQAGNLTKLSDQEVQKKLQEYASEYQQLRTTNVEIASKLSEVDDKVDHQKKIVSKEEERLRRLEEEERLLKEAQQIQLEHKKIIGKNLKKCVERASSR